MDHSIAGPVEKDAEGFNEPGIEDPAECVGQKYREIPTAVESK